MASTRILLIALPRMLEEIVSDALGSERGMEFAGTVRTVDDSPGTWRVRGRTSSSSGGDDPPLAAELLEQSPRLKVLAVAEEGQDSWLYSLRPERTRLGGLSTARLVVGRSRTPSRPRGAGGWWNR